jgi:hypothetical protein
MNSEIELRHCPKCKQDKPSSDFYRRHDKSKYQAYCKECMAVYQSESEYRKAYQKDYNYKRKCAVFSWYGGVCVCCSEGRLDFLSLDHINDDGKKDRARMGTALYSAIFAQGKGRRRRDLQILCFNCQWGTRLNGGFCPHNPGKDLRIRHNDAAKDQTS